jgi:hypothetical protein
MFRIGADPFRKDLSSPPLFQPPIQTLANYKTALSHTFDCRKGCVSHVACSLHNAFVIEDAKIVATEQFTFLLNRFVRFKVSDVTIPNPQEVVNELYGGDIVQGKVVEITESGAMERAFIVVKVEAMKDFLILPAEKVIGISDQ